MPEEYIEKVVQVNRVSKKTKGGNKINFSVIVVVGDGQSQVGAGLGKAPSVQAAVAKGTSYAKKHMVKIAMKGTTIPHEVRVKLGAAKILLKPAPAGTGVIAGGSVRSVLEAAGIRDVVSKILGTKNKISNVYAAIEALKQLKSH
ncbi:MAG: 30S ribosomal protein S5 [bacterium]|nr:30S ribosomal protein S5 [bacterium]